MPHNLAESIRKNLSHQKLEMPWRTLKSCPLFRGSLCVVLGNPGVGKSAFALNLVLTGTVPGVVISLDTDLRTQSIRTVSAMTGRTVSQIEKSPSSWASFLERKAKHIRMYDLYLNTRELQDLLTAETEYWGETPAYCIVDNISDMVREGTYEEYRKLFSDLHRIARRNQTVVVALHHVSRNTARTVGMPTLASGLYGGEQEAEIVIGLETRVGNILRLGILKNRYGEADSQGQKYYDLLFDKPTMRILDKTIEDQVLGVMTQ